MVYIWLVYKKKGNIWYVVCRINGKQKWINTKQINKKDAELTLKEFKRQQYFDQLELEIDKKISFYQFVDEYYLPWAKGTKATSSYNSNIYSCLQLKQFFKNNLLSEINYSMIEDYKIWRRNNGVGNRTVNIDLICLGQIFKEAINRGFIKKNPMSTIKKLREEKKLPGFLSKDEIVLLIESASLYLKPIIILAVNTGLRHGELCKLRWADIDWQRKAIKIAIHDKHKTKNLKEREMGLNKDAYKSLLFLKDYWINPANMKCYTRTPHQMEYVICNHEGKPYKSLKQSLKNAVVKSGLQNITWHKLRHTWASQAIMSGINPSVVQQGLGHSNISTTMIYVHLSPKYFLDKVQKLDLGENTKKLISSTQN